MKLDASTSSIDNFFLLPESGAAEAPPLGGQDSMALSPFGGQDSMTLPPFGGQDSIAFVVRGACCTVAFGGPELGLRDDSSLFRFKFIDFVDTI